MSCLECDRKHCQNIMCDRMGYGRYICERCYNELVDLGPTTDVVGFFNTPPAETSKREHSEAFFNSMFPSRRDYGDEY